MAIEGNIDLTENLDFRKDKSANTMLPAVIKGRKHDMKSLAQKDNQVYSRSGVSTCTYQITNSTQNWSYWTTDYYSIDNTGDGFDYYDIQVRQPEIVATSSTSSIGYTISNQIYWNYYLSIPIISVNYNTDGSIYIESDYDEGFTLGDKRPPESFNSSDSIFGDRKIYNDKSVNLSKLVKPKNDDSTEIGYNISSGNWYYHLDYPWDDKYDDEDIEDSFDLRDVPWIKPLYYDSRFRYNDYVEELYEDRDYSSYLTDYRWLRLHD